MDMERLLQDALAQINEALNLEAVESVRLAYFGKKGALTELSKQLGQVSAEEKPILGAKVSGLRQAINEAFEAKKQLISDALLAEK